MAGSSVVGALRVSLGLDSAQFTSGMKNAQTGLQRFAGIAKAGALAIGAAMVAAGGALAGAMKGIIDDADEMSKMAQKIGVPIDELSRLRYAAELADLTLEDLGKSLRRLSAAMLETAEGGTGPASKALTTLGIEVRDASGAMRSSTSVIEDLADRFSRMPDGVEKTALAMRIFGKSGADMIPLLNEGSAGLREMYAEAEQLGIVLDTQTGKAAEEFNDNLTRLGKVQDGIVTKITAGMLPSLLQLSSAMIGAAKDTRTMMIIGQALGWTLKALVTGVVILGASFIGVANDIATAAKAAYYWVQQDYAKAAASAVVGFGRTQAGLRAAEQFISDLWSPPTGLPPVIEAATESVETLGRTARSTGRSVDTLAESQRLAAETAREAAQIYEETRTPAEVYADEVERLTRLLNAGAISQDRFNRKMREANVRRDAEDPLSQAGQRIAEENREAADRAREDAADFAKDHEANLYDATYDGVRGGLEAAADGNLGQYLASRLREALFDGLSTSLTNMLRGSKGSGGGGLFGWLGAAGSMLKQFAGGIPGFSKGVENFGGGLAYVHKGEVLANLPKGTSVIPARDVQGGGGGGSRVVFDLRGAVMTEDLLRQMEGMAQASAGQMGRQVLDASRRAAPGMQKRQSRLGTT